MAGETAFSNGFVRGFGLVDSYYARRDNRARQDRRDTENTRRWDIANDRQAKLADVNMEVKQRQLQELDNTKAANIWSGITTGPDGNPLDITKMSPEEVEQKKGQVLQVVNRTKSLREILTKNSDVDTENPLAGMDFIYDQKTRQPSAVFTLRRKDGQMAPMTQGRSSDPNDNVVIMPLSELNSNVMSILGGKGELGTARNARRTTAATVATEKRKLGNEIALQRVKNEKETGIKVGTGRDFAVDKFDDFGNQVKQTKVWNGKDWIVPEDFTKSQNPKPVADPEPQQSFADKDAYINAALEMNKDSSGTEEEIRTAAERAWNAKYDKKPEQPKAQPDKQKTPEPQSAAEPAPSKNVSLKSVIDRPKFDRTPDGAKAASEYKNTVRRVAKQVSNAYSRGLIHKEDIRTLKLALPELSGRTKTAAENEIKRMEKNKPETSLQADGANK